MLADIEQNGTKCSANGKFYLYYSQKPINGYEKTIRRASARIAIVSVTIFGVRFTNKNASDWNFGGNRRRASSKTQKNARQKRSNNELS